MRAVSCLCRVALVAFGCAVALGARAAEITLYEGIGFAGAQLSLRGDTPKLSANGFNDRASSAIVSDGTWELCSDDGYRGTCRTYAPGRYADLGDGMTRRLSSMRLVGRSRGAPGVIDGGAGERNDARRLGSNRIVLYRQQGLTGQSMAVSGTLGNVTSGSWHDDGAYSASIEAGLWQLCADPNFVGACIELGPGSYPNLEAVGLSRPALSVRPVASSGGAAALPAGAGDVELFEAENFRGARYATDRDVRALDRGNFNDRAASAIVRSGQWQFCSDFDYRGSCTVYGPGRYPRLGNLTRQLSSVRRVQ